MFTEVEQAIVTRLSEGLNTGKGGMVRAVTTYGGQLEDIGEILGALPGIWVTFKGVTGCRRVNTMRRRWRVTADFAVFVASRSVRSETAQRVGGPVPDETGCNLIAESVRRLLTGQDLGLPITDLRPGRVTNLFRKAYNKSAVSVYVCEFATEWYEDALDNGRWPAPESDDDPDQVFARYLGRLDTPYPDHVTTHADYSRDGEVVAQDTLSNLPTESNDADS
ncbi:hypothetical protein PRCB_03070 [Pantoea rodasii]|uniref:DUF1834 domain-containing protein n=2 Tax=Pantoea rodasii TaxID=1076549 RepID=A0A2M9WHN8_9GAMM|nr:DUF1834 family protein [Pantoea rodasii]ORM59601.1 hypothetical protein HA45_22545 [Pantoea rodasii]PJZ07009.1 hypothetical protein PRCB_03070 [Pantoea rodasii]